MSDNKNVNQDKGLQGNEKIEQAIAALQQEATQEMLAHTLTVIRRRMREKGQFILPAGIFVNKLVRIIEVFLLFF